VPRPLLLAPLHPWPVMPGKVVEWVLRQKYALSNRGLDLARIAGAITTLGMGYNRYVWAFTSQHGCSSVIS